MSAASLSCRYRLHFERDSREEVEKRKRAAREQVLQPVSAEMLELDIQEVYQPGSGEGQLSQRGRVGELTEEGGSGRTGESSHLRRCLGFAVLDFPRRPPWRYEMSKEQLMSQEERSFQDYLGKIHGAYTSEKLSYFEHNLEV